MLNDSGNAISAAVLARSIFELGAHAYYVKKHFKQHLDAGDLLKLWSFITPIATGSRYMNEQYPEQSEMFPAPAHIRRVVNCLQEVQPDAVEAYSFLSEFSHPSTFAFLQHYQWADPFRVAFIEHEPRGLFGATSSACIVGLLAVEEILRLAGDRSVVRELEKLLGAIARC